MHFTDGCTIPTLRSIPTTDAGDSNFARQHRAYSNFGVQSSDSYSAQCNARIAQIPTLHGTQLPTSWFTAEMLFIPSQLKRNE